MADIFDRMKYAVPKDWYGNGSDVEPFSTITLRDEFDKIVGEVREFINTAHMIHKYKNEMGARKIPAMHNLSEPITVEAYIEREQQRVMEIVRREAVLSAIENNVRRLSVLYKTTILRLPRQVPFLYGDDVVVVFKSYGSSTYNPALYVPVICAASDFAPPTTTGPAREAYQELSNILHHLGRF